jgi:hypothetical protein
MQEVLKFLELRLAAPPVLADNWKAAIRYLAKVLIYPPGKEYRRRIPAAFAPQDFGALLSELEPPLAIPAICISVFHFLSPQKNKFLYSFFNRAATHNSGILIIGLYVQKKQWETKKNL